MVAVELPRVRRRARTPGGSQLNCTYSAVVDEIRRYRRLRRVWLLNGPDFGADWHVRLLFSRQHNYQLALLPQRTEEIQTTDGEQIFGAVGSPESERITDTKMLVADWSEFRKKNEPSTLNCECFCDRE